MATKTAAEPHEKQTELEWRVVSGVVGLAELNRPHVLNALTPSLLEAIASTLRQAAKDPSVHVVIITGRGKSFCTGADLKQNKGLAGGDKLTSTREKVMPTRPGDVGRMVYEGLMSNYRNAVLEIANCPKPVIAAMNGAAAGAGASLALACDFRIMADDAYLLQAFINVALVPDAGSSYFLVRQAGYSKALELSLQGKPIKAEECLRLGLANKVVPAKDLVSSAIAWAEDIAQKSSLCTGLTKSVLQFSGYSSLSDAIEYEARLQQFCIESDDHKEGRMAFLEKRKAKFNSGAPMSIPAGVVARL